MRDGHVSDAAPGVRVGVLGCGYWGSKHVRVLRELDRVEDVVAIDASPERLEGLASSYPSLSCCRDLAEALPEIDALVVATPAASHAALASQALSAGKHVMVEKPLATDSQAAQELVDLAVERGLTLMAGHTFEYNAAVWELRDLIHSGALGEIHYIDTARLNLGLYQADVNVIWDLAPHDVSIVNFLLGEQPVCVQAWGDRHAHDDFEDVAYLRLEYEGQHRAGAQIHVSWLDPCKVRRVTVVGSEKMAVYNDLADEERVKIYDKGVTMPPDTAPSSHIPLTYRYGGVHAPYIDFHEPLAVEDAHFVDCILDSTWPRTDGPNGLAVVEVLEAAQRSLRSREPVALRPTVDDDAVVESGIHR